MAINRKHIRFEPDQNTLIIASGESELAHTGLCLSESQGGCSGAFLKNSDFELKKMMMLKVGVLEPIPSVVRWIKNADDEIIKVGFQFLDK